MRRPGLSGDKAAVVVARDQLVLKVEQRARVRLASRLVTMYVGRKDGAIVGYAFIETHTVRSLPETILVVIDPDGRSRGVFNGRVKVHPAAQKTDAQQSNKILLLSRDA